MRKMESISRLMQKIYRHFTVDSKTLIGLYSTSMAVGAGPVFFKGMPRLGTDAGSAKVYMCAFVLG